MKEKGERIRQLEKNVTVLTERVTRIEEENAAIRTALEEAGQHVTLLRKEIDDYAKQQQELAWQVRNAVEGIRRSVTSEPCTEAAVEEPPHVLETSEGEASV